jgi:hypothetical protein
MGMALGMAKWDLVISEDILHKFKATSAFEGQSDFGDENADLSLGDFLLAE